MVHNNIVVSMRVAKGGTAAADEFSGIAIRENVPVKKRSHPVGWLTYVSLQAGYYFKSFEKSGAVLLLTAVPRYAHTRTGP